MAFNSLKLNPIQSFIWINKDWIFIWNKKLFVTWIETPLKNTYVSGAAQGLGKEQFLGLYLSASVFSSLTSYLYKMVTKQPGLSLGAVSI